MSQRKSRLERQAARGAQPSQRRARGLLEDRRVWIAAVVALVALVGAGIVAARGTGPAEPIVNRSGGTVSFSGVDPITGRQVSLDDYAGRPVVINVWGSWCPGCAAEAVDLRRFAEDHSEAQVIGVDLQDSKSGAKAFYEDFRWTHPSVFDPNGEISYSLGLQGTPSTFFLDRRHRLVTRIVGETDYAGFERGLEAALGES